MSSAGNSDRNFTRILLVIFGLAFLLAGVAYNEFLLGLFDPDPPLEAHTVAAIRRVETGFLLTGLALIVAARGLIPRIPWLDAFTRRQWTTNAVLTVIPVAALLLFLELGLQPFVKVSPTTIYVRDDTLGWKLKPGAQDILDGVPVRINGKGLRGPEVDYAKSPGITRILYLGDSVTFGDGLPRDKQSFPYLVEPLLESSLGRGIETINAGVGGYSPWQEYAYLASEGIRYAPDLIVVSFVLNDVTEKFALRRFGGDSEGWQLQNAVSGKLEKLLKGSSIAYFVRQVMARSRFGDDVQEGAKKQESLEVEDLALHPDRPQVRKAWEITLRELDDIFEYGRARGIPVVLVVFPFVFQFDDPVRYSVPQQIVTRHAAARGVPVIDLLPPLADLVERGTKPQDLFLDEDHPSEQGCRIVAQILADHFVRQGLAAGAEKSASGAAVPGPRLRADSSR
jgi:lysophospholipase L1-like esterase